MRDFAGLLKVAGIEKSAKSLARLLARVGTNLAGATERDLKYLSRRGFKGLKPGQVKALRSKGFLPTVEQELAGFDKGTENMFKWTPKAKTPPPPEFDKHGLGNFLERYKWEEANPFALPAEIVRTNAPNAKYSTNLSLRAVVIPDTSVAGTIGEREMRSAIARHEAREWVRGNAAMVKGRSLSLPGDSGSLLGPKYVGTSHMPGVIHDERVFRSQLANRLGLRSKWSNLPLEGGATRGARDVYVGNKPLPYEFALAKQLQALSRRQSSVAKSLSSGIQQSIRSNPAFRERLNALAGDTLAALELKYGRIPGLSENDIRKYLMQRLELTLPRKTVMYGRDIPFSARSVIDDVANDLVTKTYSPVSRILGVSPGMIDSVISGRTVVLPKGSELSRVAGLSPYVKQNGVQTHDLFGL